MALNTRVSNEYEYSAGEDVGVSLTPDSGISDCSPYSHGVGSDDVLDLELVFRDCRAEDGYVTREDLSDAIGRQELSFRRQQLLSEVFEQLDENQDGRVELEQLATTCFQELKATAKREMRREASPGAILMQQRAGGGTPLFSYLLSSKDGLLAISALRDLWESQLDVDDPDIDPTVVQAFLDNLSQQTGGTVNANELARNMEMLLLESTESSAAGQTFRTLAVNAYKCEIEFLLTQTDTLRDERNKLRRDLTKLSSQREVLIHESEDQKDMLHHQHKVALSAQRKAFEEQLKVVQDEARCEQDRIADQYSEQVKSLTGLVDHLRKNEIQLKEEIIDLKQESGTLEGELLDARTELNASNKMLARLKSDLVLAADCMPLQQHDSDDTSDQHRGISLSALREINAQLMDKVDELTAEAEQLKQDLRAEQRKSRKKPERSLGDDMLEKQPNVSETRRRKKSLPDKLRRRRALSSSPVPDYSDMENTSSSLPVTPVRRNLPAHKRPVALGAESDAQLEPTNLMIETMVIPTASKIPRPKMPGGRETSHELKALQMEKKRLLEELEEANSKITVLTDKEIGLESQVASLQSNVREAKQQLEDTLLLYQKQVDSLVLGLSRKMQSKSSSLNLRMKQLAHVQESIRNGLKASEQEIVAKYQTQMNELEECLMALAEDHTTASDKLKLKCRQLELHVQEEKSKYEEALKKMETLHENSIRSKEKMYVQLQDKHKKMAREKDTEIRKLRHALGDNWVKQAKDLEQKHKRETGELRETILQLVDKQGVMEEETQSRYELLEKEYKQEKETMQATINALREEKATLEASLKGAQAEMDEEYRHHTAGLHSKIVELKEERAFLEGESQARAELEEHYRQISADMEHTITSLEEDKQVLSTQMVDVERNHQEIVAELERRLNKATDSYRSNVETLKSNLAKTEESYKAKMTEMQETIRQLRGANVSAEQMLQTKALEARDVYEQNMVKWELDLNFAKAELRRYKAMYAEEMDDKQQQIEQLEREVRKLQEDKDSLDSDMKHKVHQLEDVHHSHEEQLQATIEQLQQQNDEMTYEVQARCLELEEMYRHKEAELQAVIAELKFGSVQLQDRADWLDQVNQELTRQNEDLLKDWDNKCIQTNEVTVQSSKHHNSSHTSHSGNSHVISDVKGRMNLRSVQMKNITPKQYSSPAARSPPQKTATLPKQVRIPVEEARKLTITVTDTTAQNGGSMTRVVYYGGESKRPDNVARRWRLPELRVEQLENKLHEVQQENGQLKEGVTEDKAQLLKRIERVRQSLSQLVKDLEDTPENSQASRAQLEHSISSLRNKVQKQEAAAAEQATQLKCAIEENTNIKRLKQKTDATIAELQLQLQRLTRERDGLRQKLEFSRKRAPYTQTHKTTANLTMNQTGSNRTTKSQAGTSESESTTNSSILQFNEDILNPLDETQQSLDDLNEQLLAENNEFHKRRVAFESQLVKVMSQGLDCQNEFDTARQKAHLEMLAIKEQRSALARVLVKVCSAVVATTESNS